MHPAWVRWVIPSAADLIFIALLAVLTLTALSVRLLGDAGIGWHIRTGQIILADRAIPRVDPFSSSMHGQPWFAWEWLYDVAVGGLERVAGLNGVVVLTAVIIAGVFSWTFWLLVRRGANVLVALVLVLLAASASMIHFFARPHVVSWLFTVAWFYVLERSEENSLSPQPEPALQPAPQTRLLWLLPLLMLVWVNVHGGFLTGFALLAIYWVCAAWRRWRPDADRFADILQKIRAGQRARALTVAALLCATATLVNPHGFRLHVHIYRYLSNRFLMDHIDEFQSPNFHYVAQKCFAGLLLLTLLALAAKRRQAGVTGPLIVLFAASSGLYASRNIPVSSLLLVLTIGPWLAHAMEEYAGRSGWGSARPGEQANFLQRMTAIELKLRGHLWPVTATVLVVWIAAPNIQLGGRTLMNTHFDAQRFPVAAVSYLEKEHAQGPVLSLDSWGGYLIYALYPRVQVVVDDRHDFYGEQFLRSYLKMVRVEPGWQQFLEQHPAQYVLVPKESALANILRQSAGWKEIHTDEVATSFVPNHPISPTK